MQPKIVDPFAKEKWFKILANARVAEINAHGFNAKEKDTFYFYLFLVGLVSWCIWLVRSRTTIP